jgi:hypothetical protein
MSQLVLDESATTPLSEEMFAISLRFHCELRMEVMLST